jgi:hypothetical protein
MPLPSLTPEQRAAALRKAEQYDTTRADVLEALRGGERTLADVLDEGRTNELIGRVKVRDLMLAVPGQRRASVDALLERLDIGDARRVRSLTDTQRGGLLDAVG